MLIEWNHCNEEFQITALSIQEFQMGAMTVRYFTCPNCNYHYVFDAETGETKVPVARREVLARSLCHDRSAKRLQELQQIKKKQQEQFAKLKKKAEQRLNKKADETTNREPEGIR